MFMLYTLQFTTCVAIFPFLQNLCKHGSVYRHMCTSSYEVCFHHSLNIESAWIRSPFMYILYKWDPIFLTQIHFSRQRPTWLATTASCGSSGSAAASKACSERRTVLSVIAAALKEHRHICLIKHRLAFDNTISDPTFKLVFKSGCSFRGAHRGCGKKKLQVYKIWFVVGWRMLGVLSYSHSPLVFENVQTYCTCDWADVGMPDLCYKPHLRD